MRLVDFKEIPASGETWEFFARDFLQTLGFHIESPPARGADGGKDLLISEEVSGKLHRHRFQWLVSCKHFAHSEKSVSENTDEKNILERLRGFKADGFLGFYSTLASSGLNSRLEQLRSSGDIKDYTIFDRALIENHMIMLGFSKTLMRYFPQSYARTRPLHLISDEYIPIKCDSCGKDLLTALYTEKYRGVVAEIEQLNEDGANEIVDIYFACKGECDKALDQIFSRKYNNVTAWYDLSDLAIPEEFLRRIIGTIDRLSIPDKGYSKDALDKKKRLIIAMSQKVLRESTTEDRCRTSQLQGLTLLL